MATSNSYDFILTRATLITETLQTLQVLGEGETANTNQITDHSRTLNAMVKRWQVIGTNLWLYDQLTLFTEKTKQVYKLTSDHIAHLSDVIKTQLNGAVSSGATTIIVDSSSGILSADKIGVELSDGTMQWTTVNGAPSGNTITLTAALTASANDNAKVFSYTTKYAKRPKQIFSPLLQDNTSLTAPTTIPINVTSFEDYLKSYSSKTSSGGINTIAISYINNPTTNIDDLSIYVYPTTDNVTKTIELVVQRSISDFDADGDNPDFPQEWYEALVYGLAARLSNHYKLPISERKWLKALAEEAKMEAETFGIHSSDTSIFLQPYDQS